MDLLGLFASQAAIALDLLLRARRAEAVLEGEDAGVGLVARLAATLDGLPEEKQPAAATLLAALDQVLRLT